MLFHLRTPFPVTRFGVRTELRVPNVRGCTVFALPDFGLDLAYFYFADPKNYATSKKAGPKMPQMDPVFPVCLGLGLFDVLGLEPNNNECCWPGQSTIASGK